MNDAANAAPGASEQPAVALANVPVPSAVAPSGPADEAAIDGALSLLMGDRELSRTQRTLMRSMLITLWALSREGTAIGDLKIANSALAEMTEAFRVFAPYRHVRKVTMFGSARTQPADPVYVLAKDFATRMAQAGWMVVTGAGPGIMAAGTEGAGRDHAFGVNIRLPMEADANPFIAQDPKLVEMRYFFTRKLMLIKESDGYAVLPGGFGTQDEAFELLTLIQVGKAEPAPVVLVETDGGTYWHGWRRFVDDEILARGYISSDDLALFSVATTVEQAADEVLSFYRNYHSCRWVGDLLVLRLERAPSKAEMAELNRRFAGIVASGLIRLAGPFSPERADDDHVDLPRVALRFDRYHFGQLRTLIDALNECTG